MAPILEFLKSNYYFVLYGLTLLITLLQYRWYYDGILKYFPVFVGYTILVETLGYLIADFDIFQINYTSEYPTSNNLIFNVYDLVFFMYFYFIFFKVIPSTKSKNIIKGGTVVYIIASLVNPFFQNYIIYPQLYALMVGSFVLVVCIFLFFKSKNSYLENNYKTLVWICIGLLTFVPFFPLILYIGLFKEDLYMTLHLRKVHHVLIVTMYTCFCVGFLLIKGKLSKLHKRI